jgi:hypothetical protein
MKQKVGTVIDARLIRKAKVYAAQHRKPLSGVIEEALVAYLERATPKAASGGLMARTAGMLAIDPSILATLLAEDLYDAT